MYIYYIYIINMKCTLCGYSEFHIFIANYNIHIYIYVCMYVCMSSIYKIIMIYFIFI